MRLTTKLAGLALICCTLTLSAADKNLGLVAGQIYTVSPFNEICYFTTFSSAGEPLWEIPFNTEVLSWETTDEEVIIFSKARNGSATYLTCVNKGDGQFKWERAIFAPAAGS